MATVLAPSLARSRSVFYAGMVLALMLVVFAGFMPGYFMRMSAGEPIPGFVHAHAAVFTAFLFVLLTQTLLIGARRVDLHRWLGIAAAVLVLPMLALGYETAIFGARRGHPFADGAPPPDSAFADGLSFLVVSLGDLVLFGAFFGTALLLRRRPETHKRLMILAAIGGFAWPAITRLPLVTGMPLRMFGLMALLLLALPLHDLASRRRVHWASAVGVIVILGSFPLRRAIGASSVWRELAIWLTS
jgi:hypothetical protein